MKKTVQTVNIHEAKTQLSKLVDQAVKGDPFIIAKAGKPLVKVTALDAPPPAENSISRLCRGFIPGINAVQSWSLSALRYLPPGL
jgi:prevent-host-death family protein